MVDDDDNRARRVAIWDSGIDLNMAWYEFGAERQRKQQIERRGTPASLVIQRLMMGDVYGDLASGHLMAFGFRLTPTISNGPVLIPADSFQTPMSDEWEESVVSASGYTYERVRVITAEGLTDPPTIQNAQTPMETGPSPQMSDLPRERRGGGRKSYYPEASATIRALYKLDPSNRSLSAAKLVDEFNRIFFKLHPALKDKVAPISDRSLRDHLTKFRSEEIGGNW